MNRETFIKSIAAITTLQAISGSITGEDINPIQLKEIKLFDILITHENKAFVVTAITFNHVHCREECNASTLTMSKQDASKCKHITTTKQFATSYQKLYNQA
jgi:hypothetical protein